MVRRAATAELNGEGAAGREPGRLLPWGAAAVGLLCYQLAAARFPVEWDGAQLVLGLDHFDVANGTPHPPGYWLYVAAGRLVRAATPLDGAASMTLVASGAGAVTVGLTAGLGRAMGGRLHGVLAAALVLTSPFLWFYGASVGTYALDAAACAVLVALAWHARPGSWHGLAAAAALGAAAGFRQTSLLLFAPLAVIAVARSARSPRSWVQAAVTGASAVAVWLVPMLAEQPGGLGAWRTASDALLEGSVEQTALWSGTAEVVTRNMTQGATYLGIALMPAALVGGVACGAWLGGWQGRRPTGDPGRPWWTSAPVILAAATVPAVAFLVVVHFGKAGYVLAALPAAVLLLVLPVARLAQRGRVAVAAVALLVASLSAGRFLLAPALVPESLVDGTPLFLTTSVNGAPFPFTRRAIEASDRLTARQLALRDVFRPATDVLVWGWRNGGERYRHATLTLPEFTTAFVRDSVHVHTSREGRWETVPDAELEVPPGGRAVFVLAHVPPDLELLLEAGTAEAVRLPTGPTVWAVRPGVTLLGVQVVEGDPTVDGR